MLFLDRKYLLIIYLDDSSVIHKNLIHGLKLFIKQNKEEIFFIVSLSKDTIMLNKAIILKEELSSCANIIYKDIDSIEQVCFMDFILSTNIEKLNEWEKKGGHSILLGDNEQWKGKNIDIELNPLFFSYKLKSLMIDLL